MPEAPGSLSVPPDSLDAMIQALESLTATPAVDSAW
jgi:hypothetical protein